MSPEAEPLGQPFIIRGHHLRNFKSLMSFYEATKSLGEAVSCELGLMKMDLSANTNKEYLRDLYGHDQDAENRYFQRIRKVFTGFLSLPDSFAVELVSGKKDEICKSCEVGKHCGKLAGYPVDGIFIIDLIGKKAAKSILTTGSYSIQLGDLKQKLLES
ncbi:hypothetical protein BH10PAT1_BH10PAT1_6270 [soil metagenome]